MKFKPIYLSPLVKTSITFIWSLLVFGEQNTCVEYKAKARKTALLVIMLRHPRLVNVQFIWSWLHKEIKYVLCLYNHFLCFFSTDLYHCQCSVDEVTNDRIVNIMPTFRYLKHCFLFLMCHSWAHKYKQRIPMYKMSALHCNTGPLKEKEHTWIWVIGLIWITEICSDTLHFPLA